MINVKKIVKNSKKRIQGGREEHRRGGPADDRDLIENPDFLYLESSHVQTDHLNDRY